MPVVELGQVVASRLVHGHMRAYVIFRRFCEHALGRHRQCDWGDVCEQDREMNDWAKDHDARLVSVYKLPKFPTVPAGALESDRIWIITEADRSSTTMLYPSEY